MSQGGFGQHEDRGSQKGGRRTKRRAWQARLFPELVEPLDHPTTAAPASAAPSLTAADLFRRRKSQPERMDLDAPRPRLTAEPRAWLDSIASDETRRVYRRDALDLMRRLGLDTEAKLICLERRDAVRYRDLLQALVTAGECSAGLARRRMAAALSLYDHLQRRYLVPHNPFFKLRRPREAGDEGGTGGTGTMDRRRPCGRAGCPVAEGLIVLGAAGAVASLPPRPRRRLVAADGPHQLRLW